MNDTTTNPYAEARTVADVDAIYKAAFHQAAVDAGCPDDLWLVPADVVDRLGEAHRQAHGVLIERRDGSAATSTARAPKSDVSAKVNIQATVLESKDGPVITCAGPCGETKPVKKFPTLTGCAARGAVCRQCRDADLAARREA